MWVHFELTVKLLVAITLDDPNTLLTLRSYSVALSSVILMVLSINKFKTEHSCRIVHILSL